MKKTAAAALILAGSFLGGQSAMAESQTVSIGWAHSSIEDANDLNGVNLQYRYEFNSSWGLMGSFTWMEGDETVRGGFYKSDVKEKYYSLMAGPTWRINDWASLYGALGFANTDVKEHIRYDGGYSGEHSENVTSLAWGAGVMFNPVENLSLNVGYEGTNADYWGKTHAINGFSVGVGYRF
ncbi:Ail/Lom family outer membrane beta-barrel protein [[Enterobacter] lignolyticus]|nr:Ail/Lom family outer membrane beta-barrel protein [[Enterobacter] lignolyticus]